MDGILLENMWKVVKPEDDLWIIGDFACSAPAKEVSYLHQIFNELPGARQHLIVGNHDGDHPKPRQTSMLLGKDQKWPRPRN
ncbi:MAG: hypothetical protein ABJL99_02280 [Aliishimia sp.]